MPQIFCSKTIRYSRRLFTLSFFINAILFLAVAQPATLYGQDFKPLYYFKGPCCSLLSSPLTQGRDGRMYGVVSTPAAPFSGGGSIYRIKTGGDPEVLQNFNTIAIQDPSGPLTLGDDGSYYGTTRGGGYYQYGTLFRFVPGGTVTILHAFYGGSTGVWPYGPLVRARDGNFYGKSVTLGRPDVGYLVFKATPGGTVTPVYSFDVNHSPRSIVEGFDGNLYGTAGQGEQNGSIFKLTPTGQMTELYAFDGVHGSNPGKLVRGGYNKYFGITAAGGSTNGGVVFVINGDGQYTVLHEFNRNSTIDGFWPTDLILGSDGNLYGTTWFGGIRESGVLFRLSPRGNYTVLHRFDKWHDGANPSHLMQHTNGTFYGITSAGGPYHLGALYRLSVAGIKPFILLQPASGRAGIPIGILGNGLLNTRNVAFQGASAAYNIEQDTFLTAIVPEGAATGYVRLGTADMSLKSSTPFQVLP